jgi:hypothetical protein
LRFIFCRAVFIPDATTAQSRSDGIDYYEEDELFDESLELAAGAGGERTGDDLVETIETERIQMSGDALVETVEEDELLTASGKKRRRKTPKVVAATASPQGDADDGLSVFENNPAASNMANQDDSAVVEPRSATSALEDELDDQTEFSPPAEAEPSDPEMNTMPEDAEEVDGTVKEEPPAPPRFSDDFADEFSGITPHTIKHKLPFRSILDEDDPDRRRNTLKGPGGSGSASDDAPVAAKSQPSLTQRLSSFLGVTKAVPKSLIQNVVAPKKRDVFDEEEEEKPTPQPLQPLKIARPAPSQQPIPSSRPATKLSQQEARAIASQSSANSKKSAATAGARGGVSEGRTEYIAFDEEDGQDSVQEFISKGNRVIVGPRVLAPLSASRDQENSTPVENEDDGEEPNAAVAKPFVKSNSSMSPKPATRAADAFEDEEGDRLETSTQRTVSSTKLNARVRQPIQTEVAEEDEPTRMPANVIAPKFQPRKPVPPESVVEEEEEYVPPSPRTTGKFGQPNIPQRASAAPQKQFSAMQGERQAVGARFADASDDVDPEWLEFERSQAKTNLPLDKASGIARAASNKSIAPDPVPSRAPPASPVRQTATPARPTPNQYVEEVEEMDDDSLQRLPTFDTESTTARASPRPFLGGAVPTRSRNNTSAYTSNVQNRPAPSPQPVQPTPPPKVSAPPPAFTPRPVGKTVASAIPVPSSVKRPNQFPSRQQPARIQVVNAATPAMSADETEDVRTPELFDTPEIYESTEAEVVEDDQTTPADVQNQKIVEVDPEFIQRFEALRTDPKARRDLIEGRLKGIVTVVNDTESARRVIAKLMTLKDCYHAIDTEAVELELKRQSPVGNGRVICASIYCGPHVDFGNGPRVWIDNQDDANGTLNLFREYLADPSLKKVFHNCSFDMHMFRNHGLEIGGYTADTIHMARLWNASRRNSGGYSLEALSSELLGDGTAKLGMKARFGRKRVKKDGTFAKTLLLPNLDDLQRDPEWVCDWIDYSTLDADATWHLRDELEKELRKMPWFKKRETMWDFYQQIWGPFGEVLTDMEWRGIKVDIPYLQQLAPKALEDKDRLETKFLQWASQWCPDAKCSSQFSIRFCSRLLIFFRGQL